MQAKSSKNNLNFPGLEFFLLDDEYDSDENNEEIEKIDDCIVKDSDVIFKDKEDDFIVKNKENGVIVENKEDDVMVENKEENNNLQKRKRKCSKKILLQTDINKLQNKLHVNKYFMEEIIPELVRFEEENIIVKKVICKGLYKEKYREYVLNSPAEFEGSIKSDIAARELFPEIVKTKLKLKNLGQTRCADLKNYLRAHAIWILDKTTLSIRNELDCIIESTLKLSKTSVQIHDDIHNIVNNIKQNKTIATQVRVVVLKILIEKIPPFVIAILPTKEEFNAIKIYNLLTNVIIISRDAGINLDKIIRQSIQIQKEKISASDYVFDFDPNFTSNKNIDILQTWPDDNAIHDAIKIAYEDMVKFIKVLGIKLLNDKTIPYFYVSTSHQLMVIPNLLNNNSSDIDDISEFGFNNDEFVLDDLDENSFTNVALEIA
ncbi:hypothetical protein C1645_815140 [Glomus cerebriforme]|uniref:Uncharacterized protein n=1 Tax=Glomus cerebriforme TaxID=658196 RepID=A0A397TEE8_9GLOM|nr:hypothetical protein C1645_815140 [Glomus cerebriforme]